MESKSTSGERSFSRVIERKLEKREFMRFDLFLIRRMGYDLGGSEEEREEARREAYQTFMKTVGKEKPASIPTVRKWFGIRGFRAPSREQVFRIAFSLQLSVEELKQYLMEGIHEPSFQINDYSEIIAMYCLENKRSYAVYRKMAEQYEAGLERQQELSRESNTQWLFRQFEFVKSYSEEQFMHWMWEHAKLFKGYSVTVQEFLNKYREQVVAYVRVEVKRQLDLLLSETGYAAWRKKRFRKPGEREEELIKKYLRWNMKSKETDIEEHLRKSILELTRLAYSKSGMNTRLLSELFQIRQARIPYPVELPERVIHTVSGKYLSDLFRIPDRNEIRIHTKQAIQELKEKKQEEPCPVYVKDMINHYARGDMGISDVGEALEWLEEFDHEGRRRRLIIKREDLLPMILYVAQQRYLKENRGEGIPYRRAEAQRIFTDMANATMISCNMAPLNENYMYDMILLACFQEDEMYNYGDVMELAFSFL